MVMQIYRRSLTGYDIVSANPLHINRISSKLFYYIFNKNSGNSYKLSTETFRILSRRAINRVEMMSKTIPYRKALYVTSGLKIDSISYENIPQITKSVDSEIQGSRKQTAIDTLMLFTDVAYKVSLFLSLLMIVFLC
jgi:dolichol-phosphate mannosyltransferase